MATIAQLAEKLNVSQQAIRKWCQRNQVAKDAQRRWVIDSGTEQAITDYYRNHVSQHSATCSETCETDTVGFLMRQVEELTEQNKTLQRLLDQEQQLHAATKAELKKLEAPKKKRWPWTKGE